MADPIERIQQAINSDKIVIFMKGNRSFPQCGFSAATVEVFEELGAPYSTVDVLADQEVRDAVKAYSNWPTIPQVFVKGKFIGGCDIVTEMHQKGELKPLVEAAFGQANVSTS
jgi:monothiol glutaredoxin